MSAALARHRLLSAAVITATGAGMAFPTWLYLDHYGTGAVLGAAAGVLILFAAVPAAIAAVAGDLGDPNPRATPAEWTKDMHQGGERTGRKLTDDMAAHGFLLPVTVKSLMARKWAATFTEGSSPARSLASRALGVLTTGWGALRSLRLPERSRKHGRHAATVTGTQPVPSLLHGEPEPETELVPLPEERLFPDWPTGALAAFVEAGETA